MRIQTSGPINGSIEAPPSKSLTIRALAAASLAAGRSALRRPLVSDDTEAMVRALGMLGIQVHRRADSLLVEGEGGRILTPGQPLDLGNAGTPLRLLTALCCLGRGRFVLDGSPRMRQRPVGDLLEALASLGVDAIAMHGDGCPPVELVASGFPGGPARLRGTASSQFVSALLMAAPYGRRDLDLQIEGSLVSRPYVDLTIGVMEAFGAHVDREGYARFMVHAGQRYHARMLPVEGDASSAAYFFAAAAITGGRVTVAGIPADSRQGDLVMLDLLERMGCRVARGDEGLTVSGGDLIGIDADLSDAPDLGPTLAAVALFASGATTLRGVEHLRLKESDRLEASAACVRAMGAAAETQPGLLRIHPPPQGRAGLRGAAIDPRDDHRIAMAFAVAGLAVDGVTLADPSCVSKSFPGFFRTLDRLRC